MRRQAGDDPDVNEEWSCDKGRFAFDYVTADDRLTHPMVRGEDGQLRVASWVEALRFAARGLSAAAGKVGVLPGGRLTVEDAYAYSKFARVVLRTNDIDSRARTSATAEDLSFLGAAVAGSGLGVTYADLEKASAVLLVDFEPEDESPIVFLRLRKAVSKNRTKVFSLATFAARGLTKLAGTLLPTTPGAQAAVLAGIESGEGDDGSQAVAAALRSEGAVILVGERAAEAPGTLAAAHALADATGAQLAWIPRRAGERGAIDTGCLPTLLPGGRQVSDTEARVDIGTAWGTTVPTVTGRSLPEIISAARSGDIDALVVGGVDPADLPDPVAAFSALDQVGFLVSLEIRASAVTERADVVFPVAAAAEKPGSYTDWEGRERLFRATLPGTGNLSDLRVLATLADAIGPRLGLVDAASARAELAELGYWDGARPGLAATPARAPAAPAGAGEAVLASWHELIDAGRMVEGERHLAATARPAVARVSPATARTLGLVAGGSAHVEGRSGELDLPVEVTELMTDGVVWLPANSRAGGNIRVLLGSAPGDVVRVLPGAIVAAAATADPVVSSDRNVDEDRVVSDDRIVTEGPTQGGAA
jgi:NADH-quinone oxidoreductase subunit G